MTSAAADQIEAPPYEGRAIRPYGDRILVRPEPHPEMTRSGIVLPSQALPRPDRGTVLAIGPGTYFQGRLEPVTGIREGDRVLFIRHGGYVVELPLGEYGEELLLVTPREIVAVEVSSNPLQVAPDSDWCGNCSAPIQLCMVGVLCCPACTHAQGKLVESGGDVEAGRPVSSVAPADS